MKFPYAKQSIDANDVEAVKEALTSSIITRGERVQAFEEAMARYTEASYAVAFPSGSVALAAAYHVAGMGKHDRMVATPNTFIATIAPGTELGARPVFIDIDLSSGNFDLDAVSENLNYFSTRGRLFILPVHFSGIAIDMRKLDSLIKDTSTIVIEDAAHALGSFYPDGKKVGSCAYSLMTIFSFHPAKQMTTGEGGLVTTNDPEIAQKLKLFRNNGIERLESTFWTYEIKNLSSNYNFTEMQAALGLSQLNRLENFVLKRRKLVQRYRKNLKGLSQIKLFDESYDQRTSYHLFVVQIEFEKTGGLTKEQLILNLKERGIGAQYHYIPLYRFQCYAKTMGDISEYFPNMEAYYKRALSLPLYYDLKEDDVDYICENLKELLLA